MATKSRLGRDPLNGTASPAAGKKPSHPASPRKAAKISTDENPNPGAPAPAAEPTPETMSQPPEAPGMEAGPVTSETSAVQPIPLSSPIPEGQAVPSTFESEAYTPVTAQEPDETPASAVPPIPASVPVPEGQAAPTAFETEAYAPVDIASLDILPAAKRPADGAAGPATPAGVPPEAVSPDVAKDAGAQATPPAEVFLRGVLESLAPEGRLRFSVTAGPGTDGLPVEKLFYFSHALQLLIAPLEWPASSWRHNPEGTGPLACLAVHLTSVAPDRHSLRVYDNGHFFSQYLSELHLEMEVLRPLVLFVVKRHGSIALKQGQAVEFEIIG
uniref:Uncharacterized protein n=1 Tax=Desulfovibrio sp. U5L TaxID=596152 RepID=I2Q0U3_9BACT